MGYKTKYNLGIKEDYNDREILETLEQYNIINYALDRYFEDYQPCKWYRHESDMKEILLKFPNNIFILYGNGEESPDFWKKQFINGEVDYPEFT